MSENWRSISVRAALIEAIEEIIRTGKYGSISEFVNETLRLRIEQLQKEASS